MQSPLENHRLDYRINPKDETETIEVVFFKKNDSFAPGKLEYNISFGGMESNYKYKTAGNYDDPFDINLPGNNNPLFVITKQEYDDKLQGENLRKQLNLKSAKGKKYYSNFNDFIVAMLGLGKNDSPYDLKSKQYDLMFIARVKTNDIFRPCRDNEPSDHICNLEGDQLKKPPRIRHKNHLIQGNTYNEFDKKHNPDHWLWDEKYNTWYENFYRNSYYESDGTKKQIESVWPFTGIGYTYNTRRPLHDYDQRSKQVYGVTELCLRPGSYVDIQSVVTHDEKGQITKTHAWENILKSVTMYLLPPNFDPTK